MNNVLSPKAVAQMVADREAGTPGPWHFDGPVWNQIVWTGSDNRLCFMAHSNGLNDDRDIANARRIARLPDLEAAYLTLAAENATLRESEAAALERAAALCDREHAGAYWGRAIRALITPAPSDKIAEAARVLNAACDAMWNDHARLEKTPDRFGQEWQLKHCHIKAISEAQQELHAALAGQG